MGMKKKRAALIGCGRIGFLLEDDPLRYKPCTHYGGALSAGFEISAACDVDPHRLELFSRRTGLSADKCYLTHTDLFEKEKPDLVIIATWTGSHAEVGMAAAHNGAGVVICEKPISPSLKTARLFIDTCRKHGTRLVTNHERRYEPRYRKVREMIAGGEIGEVKTVWASMLSPGRRGLSRLEDGGGPLLHDGTHLIDAVRFLFGDITSVQGEFQREPRKKGFEDRASAWLSTASGPDVFLEAGGSRDYFIFEMVISGTGGKIVIGNGYQELYLPRKSRHYTGFKDLAAAGFPRAGGPNCFTALYREAGQLLKNPALQPVSAGVDGYRALEAVHAIYLSASAGRKRIELPVNPAKIKLADIFGL